MKTFAHIVAKKAVKGFFKIYFSIIYGVNFTYTILYTTEGILNILIFEETLKILDYYFKKYLLFLLYFKCGSRIFNPN
jgi:hypothetical protein